MDDSWDPREGYESGSPGFDWRLMAHQYGVSVERARVLLDVATHTTLRWPWRLEAAYLDLLQSGAIGRGGGIAPGKEAPTMWLRSRRPEPEEDSGGQGRAKGRRSRPPLRVIDGGDKGAWRDETGSSVLGFLIGDLPALPGAGSPGSCQGSGDGAQRARRSVEAEARAEEEAVDSGCGEAVEPEYGDSDGEPLPDLVRVRLEQEFGVDLGMVRIHTDEAANELAAVITADACTIGWHIFFGRGCFAPSLPSGWSLLMREIGEVVRWHEEQTSSTRGGAMEDDAGSDGDGPDDRRDREPGATVLPFPVRAEVASAVDWSEPVGSPAPCDGGEECALARAMRTRDIEDIKNVDDFMGASESVRLGFIRRLLEESQFSVSLVPDFWADEGTTLGPDYATALERIWDSLGERVLDRAGADDWLRDRSTELGADLGGLPVVRRYKELFRSDVRALALDTLKRNESRVLSEMAILGIAEDGTVKPAESLRAGDSEGFWAARLQDQARQLVAAREAFDALRQVPVGFEIIPRKGSFHVGLAYFDPKRPPKRGPDTRGMPAHLHPVHNGMRWWGDVWFHHRDLRTAIGLLAAESPALYAALSQGDDSQLATMAASPAAEARRAMARGLRTLLDDIRAAIPRIGDDVDDRDLALLHRRLFLGEASASGIDWNQPGHQWAAEELLKDHESAEFWLSLGLDSLAAGAFVVTEIATLRAAKLFIVARLGLGAGGATGNWLLQLWTDSSVPLVTSLDGDDRKAARQRVKVALIKDILDSAVAFLEPIPGIKRGLVSRG